MAESDERRVVQDMAAPGGVQGLTGNTMIRAGAAPASPPLCYASGKAGRLATNALPQPFTFTYRSLMRTG
ncbi:hypothetical protein GCM10025771_06610 [Niveibacterium umoris]